MAQTLRGYLSMFERRVREIESGVRRTSYFRRILRVRRTEVREERVWSSFG